MKRFILSTLLTILILPVFYVVVNAAPTNYDVFTCDVNTNSFTVDVLSVVDGTVKYDSKACFTESQYGAAVTKMNELVTQGNKDVVIRYIKNDVSDFFSPLKIVASSRAMAYTQNEAYSPQAVLYIHSLVTLNSTVNYIDSKEPLIYYETNVSNLGSGIFKPSNLVAYIQINGQSGYVPLKMIDIVPFIYVENKILTPFLVRVSENSTDLVLYKRVGRDPGIIPEPVSYTVSNGEISIYIDRATTGSTILYAKAPNWLSNGKYYSPNGINFYTDLDLKNPVMVDGSIGEYYSYNNYLNFRSKSNYTGAELNNFLNNYFSTRSIDPSSSVITNQGDVFINSQNTYGMNGLLFYAFAIHESDFGRSTIATTKLNLFGYGAYDSDTSNAATYASVQEGVERHMGIQMRFYLDYQNSNLFYSSNLGNKGVGLNTKYASDPYWNVKIAAHAYRIDKALGFKDQDAYQIAILSETDRSLYRERELTSSLVSVNTRAKNYPVILNNIKNNVYQISTSNPIVNGTMITSTDKNLIPYNLDSSVAYIPKDKVKLVNTAKNPVLVLDPPVIPEDDKLVLSVKKLEWIDQSIFYVKGYSAFLNVNMANYDITHELVAINLEDTSLEYKFNLNIATADNKITLLNPYDYTKAWFEGNIDLSTLPLGHYRFEIRSVAGVNRGSISLTNSLDNAPRLEVRTLGDLTYTQRFHNKQKMRYEISIEKGISSLVRSPIIPSQINSVAFLNTISITNDSLNINGLSFINSVNMGVSNSVNHKLILIDTNGLSQIYDLTSGTGSYDISHSGFDYSNAWFYGKDIDLSLLPNGKYTIYLFTSTNQFNDLISIQDHNSTGTREFTSQTKKYLLKVNSNLRNIYYLEVEDIPQTTTP